MTDYFHITFVSRTQWEPGDVVEVIKAFHDAGCEISYEIHPIDDIDMLLPSLKKWPDGNVNMKFHSDFDDQVGELHIFRHDLDTQLKETQIKAHNERNKRTDKRPERGEKFEIWGQYYISMFNNDQTGKNEKKLIEIMKNAYERVHPFHVYLSTGEVPTHLYNYWGQAGYKYEFILLTLELFSPEMVQKAGRDVLRGMNVHYLEELSDGGMIIVPWPFNLPEPQNYRQQFILPNSDEFIDWYDQILGMNLKELFAKLSTKKERRKGILSRLFGND